MAVIVMLRSELMTRRFVKSPSGRAQIASRDIQLSRSARTLLLIVDDSRMPSQWIDLVQGSTQADFDLLVAKGLVVAVRSQPSESTATQSVSLSDGLSTLSYEQLYGFMTSQARERLGLFQGLKFILDLERCAGEAEMRKLAVRFVDAVREVQGDKAARKIHAAFGARAVDGD
jgi:hypothetical protein